MAYTFQVSLLKPGMVHSALHGKLLDDSTSWGAGRSMLMVCFSVGFGSRFLVDAGRRRSSKMLFQKCSKLLNSKAFAPRP